MKKFNIKTRMGKGDFFLLSKLTGYTPSDFFLEFMGKYAGTSLLEEYFIDERKKKWQVVRYYDSKKVYKTTKEFVDHGFLLLPFADVPTTMPVCISFAEETKGKVIVYRYVDDNGPELIVIADSFEDFANGLISKEEMEKLQ